MKIFYSVFAVIFLSILSCENSKNTEERMAAQYCGSCHAFPDPSLLDKETWEKKVLPEMAFRMGLDNSQLSSISFEDQAAIVMSLPTNAIISQENWERIKKYYQEYAPDSLVVAPQIITKKVKQFEAEPLRLSIAHHQSVTLIKQDTVNDKIYIGNRPGKLYEFDRNFEVKDSFQLKSAASEMAVLENGVSHNPRDGNNGPQRTGCRKHFDTSKEDRSLVELIDSLQRPVDFEQADLNNDGVSDYVICNFGNYTGQLVAFQTLPNGKFKKYILQHLPGARRIIIKDLDGNGMPDILALMTQGDERIVAFYNQGNFQFRMTTLLRFNPLYGSSYFEIADFNKDGKFDILYTNGDNADYSPILKPYHGVRIFLNNGANDFKKDWFYAMHGASQARVSDFDKDGDLDIAAISFFPDFKNHPEQALFILKIHPRVLFLK